MLHLFAQFIVNIPKADPGRGFIQSTVLPIVFGIAGAIAFLMIVIGAFRFVISRGNPGETAKARNTIIYAVVGLVLVLVGYNIVSFVLTKLKFT